MSLEIGEKAPEFSLLGITPEREEKEFKLSDFINKNKKIIIYFYPKDNTSG